MCFFVWLVPSLFEERVDALLEELGFVNRAFSMYVESLT